MALTPKQENFSLAYLEAGNASEAYRRAYDAESMTTDTISRKAKELLGNGKITARLSELREPILKRHAITVDDLLAELEEARPQGAGEAEAGQRAAGSCFGECAACGCGGSEGEGR